MDSNVLAFFYNIYSRRVSSIVAFFSSFFCSTTQAAISSDAFSSDSKMNYLKLFSVSQHLESLSDHEIVALLKQGTPLSSDWGKTTKLEIDGTPIFVKEIPLNQLEYKNFGSTENLFQLPLHYQYGIGSGGFNAFRELMAHQMTTGWAFAKESQNFPLMYHYRILDSFEKKPFNKEAFQEHVAYWENSSAIAQRIRANHEASKSIFIFTQYIPKMLTCWLSEELNKGNQAINQAIAMVEKNLQETALFLRKKGMIHFDAHFHNILTDGKQLYFSDFGLAISNQFTLSREEAEFFNTHINYDLYYVATQLTGWIISHTFGENRIDEVLEIYAKGEIPSLLPETLTPYLSSIIKRYAPISLRMHRFFDLLMKQNKQEPYPKDELDALWDAT